MRLRVSSVAAALNLTGRDGADVLEEARRTHARHGHALSDIERARELGAQHGDRLPDAVRRPARMGNAADPGAAPAA